MQLAVHYAANAQDRLFLLNPADFGQRSDWRSEATILASPRALAFVLHPIITGSLCAVIVHDEVLDDALTDRAKEATYLEGVLVAHRNRSGHASLTRPQHKDAVSSSDAPDNRHQ